MIYYATPSLTFLQKQRSASQQKKTSKLKIVL